MNKHLGKSIFHWAGYTAIAISVWGCSSGGSSSSGDESPREVTTEKTVGFFQEVQSDQQLLDHVIAGVAEANTQRVDDVVFLEDAAPEAVSADQVASGDGSDFSSTYVQERGVDEADVVKFDGENLFIAVQPDNYYGWFIDMPMIDASVVAVSEEADVASEILSESEIVIENAKIRVMKTADDPASAVELGHIEVSDANLGVDGLYLLPSVEEAQSDILAVVGIGQRSYGWGYWSDNDAWRNGRTAVLLYDIDDPANATETWKLEFEGHLVTTRRVDDVLYVVSRYYPNINYDEGADYSVSDILPKKVLNDGDELPLVSGTDCLIPSSAEQDSDYYYNTFVTITAINLRNPDSNESVCFDANVQGYYASRNAIYFSGTQWSDSGSSTTVHKFNYLGGGTRYAGSATVPGRLGWSNPSFRMGEREDVLHIVTSPDNRWQWIADIDDTVDASSDTSTPSPAPLEGHRLTLLEESSDSFELVEVAHIPNDTDTTPIGKPGEDVYAVRYMGDRAYVVTFMRTDPLYVIDISDKAAPKIKGDIEVTGFSSLLHPISDSLLLGFGTEATELGTTQGFKVELFNVENPEAPYSLSNIVVGERGTSSPVTFDHKALAILSGNDDDNTRFSVPIRRYTAGWQWADSGLHLFELEGAGNPGSASIVAKGSLVTQQASQSQSWSSYVGTERSYITRDTVHYVADDKVWSAPWDSPNDLVGPQ